VQNLIANHGHGPILRFMKVFPHLRSTRYTLDTLNLDAVLADADIVLVHEWSDHGLVHRIGQHHAERIARRRVLLPPGRAAAVPPVPAGRKRL